MNISIVCYRFYPEESPRAFRATELALELARKGHRVTVFASEHEDKEKRDRFTDENHIDFHSFTAVEQKNAVKTGLFLSHVKSLNARMMHYFFNYPESKLKGVICRQVRIPEDTDLIISIAVPHAIHDAVASLERPPHAIWVADCGDPFMFRGKGPHPWYFKNMEKRWCRACHYISVPFEGARQAYYPEFESKIHVIPQGFNMEELVLPKYKKTDVPTFIYAGVFYNGFRDPRPLLEALCRCTEDFRFLIYSANADKFTAPFRQRLGERLVCCKPIPRRDLLPLLCQADFLINFDNNNTVQLPSKLIDYSISGRPVLNVRKDFDIQLIQDFLHGDYSRRMQLPDVSFFDIRNVAEAFLRLAGEN